MARINLKAAVKKARAIRRAHPSMKWTSAMSQAMKGLSKGKTRSRSLSPTKKRKATRRRATVRKVKRLHRAEGRAIRSLGSVASNIAKAKKLLESQIATSEVTKFKSKTVRLKRKAAKRIAELKSRYRKLC